MVALALAGSDPVSEFYEELIASNSATAVLQRRCSAPITADVDRGVQKEAPQEVREALQASADTVIAYRSVRLKCGDVVYSHAENWYRPDRLTVAMNVKLAGDMPYGTVIAPLNPVRNTSEVERLEEPGLILRHHALVVSGDGLPLAKVVETYTVEVLAGPPQ